MPRLRLTLVVSLYLLVAILLASLLAGMIFLSTWVPAKGPAWMDAQVERHAPVEFSVGAMR
jgi:hypothetical protein